MNSVKKNFMYNSISSVLTIIVPIITTPYISRILGPSGLGTYSYNYSIATYFVTFAMLGLNSYGNRTIASVRENKEKCSKVFWEIYYMQMSIGTISVIIYMCYAGLFSKNRLMSYIMLAYVISAIFDINWFFYGMELFKLTVTRNVTIKVVTTCLIFVLIRTKDDLWKYSVIIAFGALVSQIALWPFLRQYIQFVKISFYDVLKHVKPNLILFIPAIAVSVYKLMDKIMLGMMSGMKEVGYYEAAEKLIQIPNTLVASLGTVMLPRMSNLVSKDENGKIKEYINKAIIVVMLISVPISLGIMATANQIVPIFFGAGYEKCIIILQFLMLSCIFVGVANVIRTQYLIPKKYDDIYIKSVFCGAVINAIVNLLLISKLQSIGAAIGTLCAEIVVCVYQLWKVRQELDIRGYLRNIIYILVCGIVMFCVVTFFQLPNTNYLLRLMLRVAIGVITFLVMCGSIFLLKHKKEKQ